MELQILHAIQGLHSPLLDTIMISVFNKMVGSLGEMWLVIGVALLMIP